MPGAGITIAGAGGERYSALTNAGGHFEVHGRLAGTYTISVALPPGLPPAPDQQVVVEPGQCYGAEFAVATDAEGR